MFKYRVGNPKDAPSWCVMLRFIDDLGTQVIYYEDDLMNPPSITQPWVIQQLIERGWLIPRKEVRVKEASNG